jgi:TolB-like protein/tetratricopeptide (TPR) repeat protein
VATTDPNHREILRFADFELDPAAYELRRSGRPVRLERRPLDLLILLVQHRGVLVSRSEIVEALWNKDVFVDVETGVYTAARKIRQALGDSTDAPTFVETVPGKGYRFIAPVEIRSLGRVTLAVLPFENLSGDRDREYLIDGLTEEMVSSLGQIDPERLAVLGRTSTSPYKGARKTPAQIGQELGVDYLVESSLRAETEHLRITAKLIRVRDQIQMWSATYDRAMTGVLGLQSELSTAIAEQIRLRLTPERLAAIERRHTRNSDAYDAYLRGLSAENQRTLITNERALEHYGRATTLDPEYALAWAGMASVYAASSINGDAPPLTVLPLARSAAHNAVRADPNLAEAQRAAAYVTWILEWAWPAAEAGFRRAILLDPANASAHRALGHCLSQMGRHAEAFAEMRRARELEPQFALAHALSAQVAFQARDNSAALEHARHAIVIDQSLWIGHIMAAQAYEQLGDQTRALEELGRAAQFSGGNSKVVSLRGYILAKSGRHAEAHEVVNMLEGASGTRYVPPYALALVHAGLCDRGAVFEWLTRAYAARDVHLIYLPVDPKWDQYRSDPEFRDLLTRCGFAES